MRHSQFFVFDKKHMIISRWRYDVKALSATVAFCEGNPPVIPVIGRFPKVCSNGEKKTQFTPCFYDEHWIPTAATMPNLSATSKDKVGISVIIYSKCCHNIALLLWQPAVTPVMPLGFLCCQCVFHIPYGFAHMEHEIFYIRYRDVIVGAIAS